MSSRATMTRRGRLSVWLLVIAGLLLVMGANWHLIYVAVTSQPDCVVHVRPGAGDGSRGLFSAAKSDCSP
jgi:hypothetical protein